jgi:hypothetical protein
MFAEAERLEHKEWAARVPTGQSIGTGASIE